MGTVAVGTLSMEVIVVLVKLIMDDKRRQAREEARQTQEENRALRDLLEKHNIEVPSHLVTSAEPTRLTE